MLLSIVTPFYNESEVISSYFQEILPNLEALEIDYEIICIDDGSGDSTLKDLKVLKEENSKIKIFSFSRNFGKEAAITAGLDYCKGDAAIIIDADLQDPPSEIPQMVLEWQKGFDVVLMKRKSREDKYLKRICSWLFYRVIHAISGKLISKDICDFRLIDRKVINCVKQVREKNRFMKGILSWGGFSVAELEFHRPTRNKGETKYNTLKLLVHGLNGIFAFSILPIRIFSVFGLLISFLSSLYAVYIIFLKFSEGISVPGYASIINILCFLCGVLMLGIGVIGEYVGRIYNEVKNRPIYIIKEELV